MFSKLTPPNRLQTRSALPFLADEKEIEKISTDDIKTKLFFWNKVIQKLKTISSEDLESFQTSFPAPVQTSCFPRDYGGH